MKATACLAIAMIAMALASCVSRPDLSSGLPASCASVPANLRGLDYKELHNARGPPTATEGSGLIIDEYRLASGEVLLVTTTGQVQRADCYLPES